MRSNSPYNQQYIKPTCENVRQINGYNINTASLSTYVSLLTGKIEGESKRKMWVAFFTPTPFHSLICKPFKCYVLITSRKANRIAFATLLNFFVSVSLYAAKSPRGWTGRYDDPVPVGEREEKKLCSRLTLQISQALVRFESLQHIISLV